MCGVPSDREEETWSTGIGIAGERARLPRAVVTVPTTVWALQACALEKLMACLISIRETKKS